MTTTQTLAPNNTAIDSSSSDTSEREIVVTRLLNAPRELVFTTWTQPQHVVKWWGPKGFTNTIQEMDVRPGGVWRFVMHGPDGVDYPNRIVFQEVVPVERLAYSHGMDVEDAPAQFHVTVTMDDQGGKTLLTMRMLFASAEERTQMVEEFRAIEGLNSTLDCLEEHLAELGEGTKNVMTLTLPSDLEFTLTRVFNAPRHLVFAAWTEPEHVKRWWGCNGSAMPVCEIDLRVGGAWRYVVRMPDGAEFGFNGVYREIEAPKRLVHTSIFEPMPEHEALVTVLFEEHDGKTTLIETTLHKSVEARDGHLQSGMEAGAAQTFDRLEALLEARA
ncbi:hypothetical protein IAD21_02878 [Abditibacteriota bacterium]|nr:hypothetical protein IAD21_02878 [Abditibacteriota bacterium]